MESTPPERPTAIFIKHPLNGQYKVHIKSKTKPLLHAYIFYSYKTEKESPDDQEKVAPLLTSLVRAVMGILLTLLGGKITGG